MHVSLAGAPKLVEQAARGGQRVGDQRPRRLIANERTGAVARRLVYAIHDRLQSSPIERSADEVDLISELGSRQTRALPEAFAAAARAAWIDHEARYPACELCKQNFAVTWDE
jgi:hypothetical protein